MASDAYDRLALALDRLPGGFPHTPGGVEMRLLRRLFTPEEAELALHLSLLPEEPRVVAYRARIPEPVARRCLEQMDAKGLVYSLQRPGRPRRYQMQQFVIGIWEAQVDRLDRDLVLDFEEYLDALAAPGVWLRAPQLRTIPVDESVPARVELLPYEQAGSLVRGQSALAVSNCICRQEMHLLGRGCTRPLETCLTFGTAAHHVVATGRGRAIGQAEALDILRRAADAGLVLQPGNARDSINLCACCGCCCGVLRALKRDPHPARAVASPFAARVEAARCEGCGLCAARCPMDAIRLEGTAAVDPGRCIGCGLCARACPTGTVALARKPRAEQPRVPHDIARAWVGWMRARGTMGYADLLAMWLRSRLDRLRAPRAPG